MVTYFRFQPYSRRRCFLRQFLSCVVYFIYSPLVELTTVRAPLCPRSTAQKQHGRRHVGIALRLCWLLIRLPGCAHFSFQKDQKQFITISLKKKSSFKMVKFLLPRLTNRQWATALVIAFADFCSAVCISLQAPFYPAEVRISLFQSYVSPVDILFLLFRLNEKEQLRPNMVGSYTCAVLRHNSNSFSQLFFCLKGFVFGCYELTVFLTSPLFGKYVNFKFFN